MGKQSYSSVLGSEKLSTNAHLTEIITRVGQRIATQANRPDYAWEFKLIDKNEQNAFCLPGGKIAIYTGILPIAKNEAGLATVMAHEVTHAIARHGGQRMSLALASMGGLFLLQQTTLKDKDPRTQGLILGALGAGLAVGVVLPYSRSHEIEADEVGQTLMAKAGYDPSESIHFWGRFATIAKSNTPSLLSTHPSSQDRANNMKERLPASLRDYQAAPQQYGLGALF